MTSKYRHRRSSAPDATFAALEPGEIGVNTTARQLTVGDAASATIGTPIPLLAIRIFDTRAIYAAGDYVMHEAIIYRANAPTGPGGFIPTSWAAIAGGATGESAYVIRTGDTMTGHLTLPPGPNPAQAVRRDQVEFMIAPLATMAYVNGITAPLAQKSYVDAQDATFLPRSGGTMTGPLSLAGDPTAPAHAASKNYVDSRAVPAGIPVGMIMDFAGPNAPTGWYPCDGWEIGRTDHPALFAAIGTTWGAGNGSTTFNIPSFQTRYRRHRDNSPSYANTVGTYQSPVTQSHYHGVNITSGYVSSDHQHYVSGTTGAADRSLAHNHGVSGGLYGGTTVAMAAAGGSYIVPIGTGAAAMTIGVNVGAGVDHLHGFGAWTGGISANHQHGVTGNTGGGSTDGNETRPYSATVLACIKAFA